MQPDLAIAHLENLKREHPEIDTFELEEDGALIIEINGMQDASTEQLLNLLAAVESFGIKALLVENLKGAVD